MSVDQDRIHMILRGRMGSHCHGLNTPASDTDIRGVGVVDEMEYHLGLKRFDTPIVKQSDGDEDTVIWGLRQFIHLALKGNTNAWNLLWCREEDLTVITEFGQLLRRERESFSSMRMRNVLKGYYIQEYREATGKKTGRLGAKRKKSIERYGYSVKNAGHCIRLLHTGMMFFETGIYPVWFEEDERRTMLQVKLGEVSLERFNSLYEYGMVRFDNAVSYAEKRGLIPEEPDTERVHNAVMTFLLERIDKADWR